jgi:dTDP-4-dehydrorhamnose 3,5-epimerase
MKVQSTALPEVLLIEPCAFEDARGFFMETWNEVRYREMGLPFAFRQDNLSYSLHHVLRGLHFQYPDPQGKLVYVLQGEVFDVAVDIRLGSPTFGDWVGAILSASNRHQFYIPEGFAHGFCVLSTQVLLAYKCTVPYNPLADASIRWDDPDLAIDWPIQQPLLSPKDAAAPRLRDIAPDRLPSYRSAPARVHWLGKPQAHG